MFDKVLIANRGAIACRIIRTLRRIGVKSVAVYTEADALSRHVVEADEAYCIGSGPAAESYLRADKILEIARHARCEGDSSRLRFLERESGLCRTVRCARDSLHRSYPAADARFRPEAYGARAGFAEPACRCCRAPACWRIWTMRSGKPAHIGYPVMLKSTAGGGGIGMRLCWNREELGGAYEAVKHLAQNNFKDAGSVPGKICRECAPYRSADFRRRQREVIALGERDCSMQRRNQKVIEETPAPNLSPQRPPGLAGCGGTLWANRSTINPPAPWNTSTMHRPANSIFSR